MKRVLVFTERSTYHVETQCTTYQDALDQACQEWEIHKEGMYLSPIDKPMKYIPLERKVMQDTSVTLRAHKEMQLEKATLVYVKPYAPVQPPKAVTVHHNLPEPDGSVVRVRGYIKDLFIPIPPDGLTPDQLLTCIAAQLKRDPRRLDFDRLCCVVRPLYKQQDAPMHVWIKNAWRFTF